MRLKIDVMENLYKNLKFGMEVNKAVLPLLGFSLYDIMAVFRWWCKIFRSTITLSFLFSNRCLIMS
jgi:hypothetical protein